MIPMLAIHLSHSVVSECEHLVDLIVSDVAGNHGIERWNLEHGTRRDIALANFNHAQFVPFKVYDVYDVTIERRRSRGRLETVSPKQDENNCASLSICELM
jgi:hypothetical protein